MEPMKTCRKVNECQMWLWMLIAAGLVTMSTCSPIMVYEGTRMAPIEPPLPAPRMLAPYPPLPPAPVWEDPEPELNSVYRRPPPRYGFRLKPLLKSYTYPYNGYSKTYGYKTI